MLYIWLQQQDPQYINPYRSTRIQRRIAIPLGIEGTFTQSGRGCGYQIKIPMRHKMLVIGEFYDASFIPPFDQVLPRIEDL